MGAPGLDFETLDFRQDMFRHLHLARIVETPTDDYGYLLRIFVVASRFGADKFALSTHAV